MMMTRRAERMARPWQMAPGNAGAVDYCLGPRLRPRLHAAFLSDTARTHLAATSQPALRRPCASAAVPLSLPSHNRPQAIAAMRVRRLRRNPRARANVAMRLWLASPQRRSRAATDWPGVRPISPARRPIPMPIPTREPVPLVRRAERAWFAPTWCIGHKATFRRMAAREPARATNAGGPAARDECVSHERERGRSARPLAIASSAASDRRGGRVHWHTVPPLLLVARPWSAAPRCR